MVRALDTAGTAEALDRYRERAGRTLAGSVAALVGGVVVGILPGPAWTGDVVAWAVCLGVVFACVGAGALVTARRMRAVLAAGEWSAHAAVPVARRLHPRRSSSPPRRPAHCGRSPSWPCGGARTRPAGSGRRAVVVRRPAHGRGAHPPHGGELFWAKPVRGGARGAGSWGGRRSGAARRRGPSRSATGRGSESATGPEQATGPQPAAEGPLPAEAPSPGPLALAGPGLGPGARPAVPWGLASVDDPQIDLTVLSEEPGGECVVRWKDPWDGRERTGPFRCDPDRDPLLARWETAFVVSYGPGRASSTAGSATNRTAPRPRT